jgi:hypothetical protein
VKAPTSCNFFPLLVVFKSTSVVFIKYGKSSSLGNRPGEDSEDSDSEEEDDDAELATLDVE